MTKFVSVIGNGESRRGFDITPLKSATTMVGCNALFRDHNLEYVVCADRHMCQEAANTVGKNTTIYTRDKWYKQFAFWPNVKCVPDLPYQGDKRQDDPFHWGTGQFAALVGTSFKPKAIFLVGMDLYGFGSERIPENVNTSTRAQQDTRISRDLLIPVIGYTSLTNFSNIQSADGSW